MKDHYKVSDKFVGGVSPFLLFEMEYHSLFYVVQTHKDDKFYTKDNPASQVACIGLLAYFEAFCKHQFAAIVNIMPSLIKPFCSKRGEPKIEFSTITTFEGNFEKNVGFVLAEIYDFGTPKSINSIFFDLLKITPFNDKETLSLNSIIQKRNLLVHHAGYYTLQSLKKETNLPEAVRQKAFKEAIKIDTNDFEEISDFLFEMAMKITRTSVNALKNHPDFKINSSNKKSEKVIEELLQGLYDTLY